MELLLVRHAESAASVDRSLGDEPLSARGREQAGALARALAPLPVTLCLSSPLLRARETAELALEGRDIPLEVVPDLAEASVGALEGLKVEEARRRYPDDFRLGPTTVARIAAAGRTAPQGELRDEFLARVERALARVERELSRDAPGVALVVSHGGLLNYLLQRLLSIPVRDEVPFGFEYCGAVRLLSYSEAPAFGPFPMLSFAPPAAGEGRD